MKRCPECGYEEFYVTVHVTQEWKVDGEGNFIAEVDPCMDVTHRADDIDLWECAGCGRLYRGTDLNVKEE